MLWNYKKSPEKLKNEWQSNFPLDGISGSIKTQPIQRLKQAQFTLLHVEEEFCVLFSLQLNPRHYKEGENGLHVVIIIAF